MAKENFETLITRMEAAADKTGNSISFWQQVSLVLTIWSDSKRGWMPVVEFDPRHNTGLRDLADAFRNFGDRLLGAVNQRAFAA